VLFRSLVNRAGSTQIFSD